MDEEDKSKDGEEPFPFHHDRSYRWKAKANDGFQPGTIADNPSQVNPIS